MSKKDSALRDALKEHTLLSVSDNGTDLTEQLVGACNSVYAMSIVRSRGLVCALGDRLNPIETSLGRYQVYEIKPYKQGPSLYDAHDSIKRISHSYRPISKKEIQLLAQDTPDAFALWDRSTVFWCCDEQNQSLIWTCLYSEPCSTEPPLLCITKRLAFVPQPGSNLTVFSRVILGIK